MDFGVQGSLSFVWNLVYAKLHYSLLISYHFILFLFLWLHMIPFDVADFDCILIPKVHHNKIVKFNLTITIYYTYINNVNKNSVQLQM